jgi:hypothetical protein
MATVTDLQDFYTKLKNQGVRLTHQYQLNFTIPNGTGIPSKVATELRDVTVWAEGAQVPGRDPLTTDMSYLGYPFKIPTTMQMTQELELTIRCQNDMSIHQSMLAWMATITNPDIDSGSATGGDKRLRDVRIRMDLLDDEMNSVVMSYELIGVFPSVVGPIDFNNNEPEIATFSCTMTYQYWKVGENNSDTGYTGI